VASGPACHDRADARTVARRTRLARNGLQPV